MPNHCAYCTDDDLPCCGAKLPESFGYVCTRAPDHDGPHAACGAYPDEHPIETWENCPHCADAQKGNPDCGAADPSSSCICTKPPSHTGPHVACGIFDHNLATWESNPIPPLENES